MSDLPRFPIVSGYMAVLDPIEPGYSVRVATTAGDAARTLEAVADSLPYSDLEAHVVVEDSDRIDLDVMEHGSWPLTLPHSGLWTMGEVAAEHTRQSRLRAWQEQRP